MTRICVCLVAAIALALFTQSAFAGKNAPPAHRHYAHRHHHGTSHITVTGTGRYFGADPDRYFGIGPGSYECFGYDCNW
jgi:hypothetical protein